MDEQQTRSQRSSPSPSPGGIAASPVMFYGKHRMAASIAHLNNQISIIEKELEQLETIGESSLVCKEVVSSVGSLPDPLLPLNKGPTHVAWDRWFQGSNNSRSQKRWI